MLLYFTVIFKSKWLFGALWENKYMCACVRTQLWLCASDWEADGLQKDSISQFWISRATFHSPLHLSLSSFSSSGKKSITLNESEEKHFMLFFSYKPPPAIICSKAQPQEIDLTVNSLQIRSCFYHPLKLAYITWDCTSGSRNMTSQNKIKSN